MSADLGDYKHHYKDLFRKVHQQFPSISKDDYREVYYDTLKLASSLDSTGRDNSCIPRAFDDMVEDDSIPMIVDLARIAEFEQRWKNGLSERARNRYEAMSDDWRMKFHRLGGKAAWAARVKKHGIEAARDHMRKLGQASWAARVKKHGIEAAYEHMSELGLASWAARVERDGFENACEYMRDLHARAAKSVGGASELGRRGITKATKNCGGVNPFTHWAKSASSEKRSEKSKIAAATQKKNGNGGAVYNEKEGRENNLALGMVEQGDLVKMMCTLCGVEKASRWKFHENGVMKVVLFKCNHRKEDGKQCKKTRQLLNGCNLPTISKGALYLRAEKKKKK